MIEQNAAIRLQLVMRVNLRKYFGIYLNCHALQSVDTGSRSKNKGF